MKFTYTYYQNVFNLEVHGLYNFILGDSGTGKTFLLQCIELAKVDNLGHTSDNVVLLDYPEFLSLCYDNSVPRGAVVYVDESSTDPTRKREMIQLHELIKSTGATLLYSVRTVPHYFEFGINDVFVLNRDSDVYTMSLAYTTPPIMERTPAVARIICEDAKSGFLAMGSKYSCDVVSAGGKSNVVRAVNGSSVACGVYVDLCGAGADLPDILALPNTVPGTVVAPSLSFECDALRKKVFCDSCTPEMMVYSDDIRTHGIAEEDFYTLRLCEEFSRVYSRKYRKGSKDAIALLCDETSWLPQFNVEVQADVDSHVQRSSIRRMKLGG